MTKNKEAQNAHQNMILSAFDMHTVGHQSPGLWTHPEDESPRYKDLDYWLNLAKRLEQGGFDPHPLLLDLWWATLLRGMAGAQACGGAHSISCIPQGDVLFLGLPEIWQAGADGHDHHLPVAEFPICLA